jgi:hypothetical protein
MTTRDENDLLTRTGPGTAGGDLFRRYWQPVALSEELKDAPLQVKIILFCFAMVRASPV